MEPGIYVISKGRKRTGQTSADPADDIRRNQAGEKTKESQGKPGKTPCFFTFLNGPGNLKKRIENYQAVTTSTFTSSGIFP
jgi:hypothetical protein